MSTSWRVDGGLVAQQGRRDALGWLHQTAAIGWSIGSHIMLGYSIIPYV
jgi:hypothetical protein